MDLAELPADHQLRARPLAEIRAEYRNRRAGDWKLVTPAYGIAKASFNDLATGPWPTMNYWRAPAE